MQIEVVMFDATIMVTVKAVVLVINIRQDVNGGRHCRQCTQRNIQSKKLPSQRSVVRK